MSSLSTFGHHGGRKSFVFALLLLATLLCTLCNESQAQTFNLPATGSQISLGGGCYNLTPSASWPPAQRAVIWYSSTVDFNNPFVIKFDATVDNPSSGADGFVVAFGESFSNVTSPHETAGKIGYYGTSHPSYTTRSFGIEFDTYDNGSPDIAEDHIAICLNADQSSIVEGPYQINGTAGIKDNVQRTYRITWDPAIPELKVYRGSSPCALILTSHYDFKSIFTFGRRSNIKWGITSGSGGGHSNHIICNTTDSVPTTHFYDSVCLGGTTTISGPSGYSSYTWSTGATTTSITATIGTYTVTAFDSCDIVRRVFHIRARTNPVITGVFRVCEGETTSLAGIPSGGTWSSSNVAVGTISSSGVVGGLTAGTTMITYTDAYVCFDTAIVTVDSLPDPITGTLALCTGTTTTLSSATPGGTWVSSNTSVATIGSTTGILNGLSAGTTEVTYAIAGTGCRTTTIVTVNEVPTAINGTKTICVASSTVLTGVPSGGTWTSSDPTIASISTPLSGTIGGVAVGTATITYTLPGGCHFTTIVTVNPIPDPIGMSPSATICVGSTVTATNTTPGGTWVSTNFAVATVGASSGVVSGNWVGTAVIRYILTATGCARDRIVTVTEAPTAAIGDSFLCVGDIATHIAVPSTSVGTWSSSNTSVAAVGSISGFVIGVAAGTAQITYHSAACSTTLVRTITVNPLPTVISGALSVCLYQTTTLTSSPGGGSWSSSGYAGIINLTSGMFTSLMPGTSTITYTLGTGCFRTAVVTVNDLPSTIAGEHRICTGSTTTLNSTPSGGTWSSSATEISIVGSSGVVSGLSEGTAIVTYTNSFGCIRTSTVTVYATPASIAGTLSVCQGVTTPLFNSVSGGSWSSASTSVGTIDPLSGMFYGVSAGTTTVSYSTGGYCHVTAVVTVHPTPVISGSSSVCVGATISLTAVPTGGTWGSDTPPVATVGTASGVVTGNAPGVATISYTSLSGCISSKPVTVNLSPGPITGTLSLCVGDNTLLGNSAPGGTWSSGTPAVAGIGMPAGTIIGVSSGTATITYTMPGDCITTADVTVNPVPAIIGDSVFCTADTTTLTSDISGGTWTSSAFPVIAIDATTGELTATLPGGTSTITYTLPTGCYKTLTVTFNPTPSPITGPDFLCEGDIAPYSSAPSGGTWAAFPPSVITIDAAGTVTAAGPGVGTIHYSFATGCFSTRDVTVNPLPAPIDGTFSVCELDTTDLNSLGYPDGVGTWTSSITAVATVNPVTGVVTGILAGTTVISYTLPTGCFRTAVVTVNPLPGVIFGDISLCEQGDTTTLYSSTAGGTWTGGTLGIALLTGMHPGHISSTGAGTATFTYTLATGCYRTATVTVHPTPDGIVGSINLCVGSSGTIYSGPPPGMAGGTWVSVTPSVATVHPTTGDVYAVSVGTSQITYTSAAGCYQLSTVHVFPVPGPISGITQLCVGDTATLYCPPPGGYWLSGATSVATIDAITGLWTAHTGGTAVITYVGDIYAQCSATVVVTVGPIVGPITSSSPSTILCVGDTTTFGHADAGGIWSSSNDGIATWTPAGPTTVIITGVSPGTVTISYSVTDTCGTTVVTKTITILGVPGIDPIGGVLGVCSGFNTTLIGTPPGGVWVSDNPAIASVTATVSTSTESIATIAGHIGSGSVTISYTVTNPCGSATSTANVLVNMEPYITANFVAACQTLSGGPDQPDPVISGHGECIKVCDSSVVRYYAHGVHGSAFTWEIGGGTVIANYGDSIDVFWTTVGLTGSIVLHDTFAHCIDSASACVIVIDKPDALFSSLDSAYCINANVLFTDLSTGDPSSPIVYWHWNFGDGTATSTSTSTSVEHAYSSGGTYTVTLTVRNQCNCTDSFKKVIEISKYESPLIICPSVVCDSEYATYTTKGNCTTFVWTVDGGTYMFDTSGSSPGSSTPISLDPTGTILTEGTGRVTIRWDQVDSAGFGYITLYTPGCSLCTSPTTLKVPVILPNANVKGRDSICTNTQELYELPLWPATSYKWGVLGNPGIIPLCREDHKVVVSFPTAGTYTLHGTYQNQIKLCGGDVFKVITVRPPSAITGARRVCLGTAETYSLTSGHSGTWEVKDHLGNVIATSAGAATTFNYLFPATGTYKVWAYGDFCADHYTVTVIDIPSIADSIIGPDTVCLRRPYTYRAANNIAGYVFEWQAIGGSVSPVSGLSTVTVDWISTGTKQLRVRRIDVAEPFCPGPWLTIDVTHEIVNPNVTGNIYPCANTFENYTANYTRAEVYDWAIYPNTAGSVITGLHANTANVLWNNVPGLTTASVVVTVRKCDSTKTDTLQVTIASGPPIALLSIDNDTVCSGGLVAFEATPGGDIYNWDMGDEWSTTTGSGSATHWYPKNHTASYRIYTVTVTASGGGCGSPSGDATGVVYVKPGVDVMLTANDYSPCTDDSVIIEALVSTNVPVATLSWYGSVPPIFDGAGHVLLYTATTISAAVLDSNGCRDTASLFIPFYNCDSVGGPGCGDIPVTITSTCNVMTLLAGTSGSPRPGYWVRDGHNVVPTYGNPATAVFPTAGIYNFYFRDTVTRCRTKTKTGKIYATSDFSWTIKCSTTTPGMYDVFLQSKATQLPDLMGVYLTWDNITTGATGFSSATAPTAISIPAGTSVTIGHRITGTIPGEPTDGVTCYATHTITAPAALSVAFTPSATPLCERLPINFTPTVTGSGLSYFWDFDDGATLLLANGKREFTWASPFNPNSRNVKLRVKDRAGCIDSATNIVEIYENAIRGGLGPDTTICSGDAPYTLVYDPASGSSTPLSYLWSTTATTPTISINQSGAYWVTVTGAWQCSRTMPADSAVAVRIIQTPPAIIRGPRHYCAGDEINLNGYAGEGILYQWLVDGVATTAPTSYVPARWTSLEDTFSIQLRLRIYDSVTQEYCDVYSAIDTIRVYPLPAPPTVTGPLVVDCDAYRLTLIASSGVSGTFNWVGLPAGPVANINMGGPYKVWFTDLRGCVSTTTVYVPLDPRTYEPYFPDGCYDICKQQMPLTVYGPPCASFDYWAWGGPTGVLSAGMDEMDSLDISDDGPYQWVLDNGLCKAKIGIMDLTNLKCNACQGVALGAVLHCTPDSPSSYSIDVSFNTSYPATTYVLGTDIGPITPFTGSIAGAGSYTASLKFTTMERDPLPDSVTIKLVLTTLSGLTCYEEVTIPLDTCSWIAERGTIPQHTTSPVGGGREGASALLVFPNPAADMVSVQYDYGYAQTGMMLSVYDAMGRKVAQTRPEAAQGSWPLNAAEWVPGMYVVRMEGNGQTLHVQRIIIIH